MALLEVSHLKLTIDGSEILRDMNVRVEDSTVHAVVGPNGAGKTSLAASVMGLPGYAPDAGTITFAGQDIGEMAIDERARLGLSLAWQEPARFEGLSVRDFLSVGAVEKDLATLRRALQSVALDPDQYLDRFVDTGLSGGERKRVELASIAVMEPRLVILDEPDSGIDVEALSSMFHLLDELRDRGCSVLLVTHSTEVLQQADFATLVCCGKDVDRGRTEDIRGYFEERCIPCEIHNPDIVEG